MKQEEKMLPVGAALIRARQCILGLLEEHAAADESEKARLEEKNIAALVGDMHRADIADFLESLPKDKRPVIWRGLSTEKRALVVIEVSEPVRADIIEQAPDEETAALLARMPGEDVAMLLRGLPNALSVRLLRLAGISGNDELRASMAFEDDTVGAIMDFQPLLAKEQDSVGTLQLRLREMGELPSHCDKFFVVDDRERLIGVLPLKRLLLNAPEILVRDVIVSQNIHAFHPEDDVEKAAGAFERYDLITAPVLDNAHRIVGRITINEILAHNHRKKDLGLLNSAGMAAGEDLFATVPRRFAGRWRWLFVNLIAAFIISRVVGFFETSIAQLAALAVLMPIVASMSGNIGNQTATMTVRSLALGQINTVNWRAVLRGEIGLSLVNGVVWGGLVAVFAYWLYGRVDLALVLFFSMGFCFLAAAISGFMVPLLMQKLGKDPALGATVVLTGITDTLGFFVFLGLGSLLLI